MKFVCMGYYDPKKWEAMSPSEQQAAMEECFAYDDILRENGHWADSGQALQSDHTAKTIQWKSGKVVVTDGPFVETKEQLGGLGVLQVRDINEAIELMSKHPAVRLGTVFEFRAVDENAPCAARHKAAAAAATKIFVNLPVKNLHRSKAFFEQLGFRFNPQFTNETAACLVVSDTIFVMLLTEPKFREFAPNSVCDASVSNEVLVCLSRSSRDEVDELVRKAVAAGGSAFAECKDYGFMYQHAFQDLDGHVWELIHMESESASQRQEELVSH